MGKTIQLHPAKGKNQQGGIIDTILVGVPSGPAQAAPAPAAYTPLNPVTSDSFESQQNEGCNDFAEDDLPPF